MDSSVSNDQKKRRLKNWLVNYNLQIKILFYFFLLFLFFILLGSILFYFHFSDLLYLLEAQYMDRLESFKLLKSDFQKSIMVDLILCLFGLASFTFAIGGLLSHRIAGAIFGIQKGIKKLKETQGKEKIQIRENDLFQDLVEDINGLPETTNDKND